KMIPTTSFAEKSDQASRFFVLNRSLRAASPRPSGTGDPFLFLRTGAEAPAYSRSASPRRSRFYSSAIHPDSRVPVVSVLKALKTNRLPRRPIFLLVTEPNDSSDGMDVSAEVRSLPDEGGGRPSHKKRTSANS